ncbi:hypothetical protein SOVF_199920 [Spinacia oleracea]|uniref:Benzyl alcohol O-benzoyltransferase-like n=1 Tax=Spinacia oleracea TaxID=3562 RepID=A0A9R0IF97_SPIOL|nr:benzyl alcohol O-benzoyltransferase-like [Spinacia oleracea]KNA04426.1 hypothetical protein SOVF_199920 [Spinacia oleracea]
MALMAQENTSLVLSVTRGEPEFVCPEKPTPRELKLLSDIDDQEGLRFHMPGIMFYRADPSNYKEGKDPVKVVKDALAKALVFFYPYAGRLVEGPSRKLSVDCTAEGVPFIEADADATLEDFGGEIHPPFPLEDLLYDIPGTDGILGTPLLIIQVTRLRCGGFIVALRVNHVINDGSGIMQLMNAVGEISRGFTTPSILPVWDRERLTAGEHHKVSYPHPEYDQHQVDDHHSNDELADLIQQSFLFGPSEIAALRRNIPPQTKQFSTFDILSASLWRCRTMALGLDPDEEVRLLFAVNARTKFNPPLAKGYYGNACAFPAVCAKAGDICNNKVEYILELIRKAKNEVNEEYMRSIMDLMVTKDRPHFSVHQSYVVSDLRHLGFADVDFGWGKPVFGGPGSNGSVPDASFFISFKNIKGETMIMVPISLPVHAMDVFVKELGEMLRHV